MTTIIMHTSEGDIRINLFDTKAPHTVENFLGLATGKKEWTDPFTGQPSHEKFYDGLTFHRIIKDFMIQGGCPDGNGMGDPGWSIEGEFASNGFTNNLKHTRGVLSMARRGDSYDSGSCQFFICHQDCAHLDGSYAAFGRVTEGIEVVDEICNAETDESDRPKEDIIIKEIKIIE